MKSDDKLWKSSEKNRFELFFWGLFTLYGVWLFAREGFSLINTFFTVLVALVLILKIRSDLKLSNKETLVNKDLSDRGYKIVLENVTTVAGVSNKFKGLVKDMVAFSIDGATDKYSVGLSTVEGVTFYHFNFSQSKTKWVAVVDGLNVQYFTN